MKLTATCLVLTDAELLEAVEHYWRYCGHARADIERVMVMQCAWGVCPINSKVQISHSICEVHQAEMLAQASVPLCKTCGEDLEESGESFDGVCCICAREIADDEKAAQKRQDELDDKMIGDR